MQDEKPTYPRLIPILYVRDLDSEVDFYTSLGFEITYQGDEFPGFIALNSGEFEFGLKEKEDFDPLQAEASFVWQMEVDSFTKVLAICVERALEYSEPKQYWEARDAWEMTVQTPNGYSLHLDKLGKD